MPRLSSIPKGLSPREIAEWLLENHTEKSPDSDCLLWTGRLQSGKYPLISVYGQMVKVCRYIYRHTVSDLPGHVRVKHSCDNQLCVNSEHLFIQTQYVLPPSDLSPREVAEWLLENHTEKSPGSDCLLWTGPYNSNGYPRIRIGGGWVGVHRYIYRHTVSDLPGYVKIKHSCDNRKCVRPEHLFIRTQYVLAPPDLSPREVAEWLLENHTEKSPDSDCLLWTGSYNAKGYPRIQIGGGWVGVHRYIYRHTVGDVSKNAKVKHSCDNRKCVNPEHLYVIASRYANKSPARGRWPRGFRPKLSEKDVLNVRKRLSKGETFSSIALDYGVKPQTISDIAYRKTWAYLQSEADIGKSRVHAPHPVGDTPAEIARWLLENETRDGENGCRIWKGVIRQEDGVGLFSRQGKQHLAHRYIYRELVDEGLMSQTRVEHTCGVYLCVNPEHMRKIVRQVSDADSGSYMTADERDDAIRLRLDAGESVWQIARIMRCDLSIVKGIKLRRDWAWYLKAS